MPSASLRRTLPALLTPLLFACGEGVSLTRVEDPPTPEVVPGPDAPRPEPGVAVDEEPDVPVDPRPTLPGTSEDPIRGLLSLRGHAGYSASAEALFIPAPATTDVQGEVPFLAIALDTCTTQISEDSGVGGLDVGDHVALGRGNRAGASLTKDGRGRYYTSLDPHLVDPNTGEAQGPLPRGVGLDVIVPGANGGANRRFLEVVWIPADPRLTVTPGADGNVVMHADQPFSITFEPGGSDHVLLTFYNRDRSAQIHCRITDDGEFTLTPEFLAQLAPSGTGFCLERYNVRDVHLGDDSLLGVAGMIHSIGFVIE